MFWKIFCVKTKVADRFLNTKNGNKIMFDLVTSGYIGIAFLEFGYIRIYIYMCKYIITINVWYMIIYEYDVHVLWTSVNYEISCLESLLSRMTWRHQSPKHGVIRMVARRCCATSISDTGCINAKKKRLLLSLVLLDSRWKKLESPLIKFIRKNRITWTRVFGV